MVRTDRIMRLNEKDNVAVALHDLEPGTRLGFGVLQLITDQRIPKGHKIALQDIAAGNNVMKYGYSIGLAKTDIAAGQWVHTHNMHTGLEGELEYTYVQTTDGADRLQQQKADQLPTFLGYERENGEVGIRNEVWIINTVGCVNKTAEILAKEANRINGFTGVVGTADSFGGVFTFPHPYGCSQLGDDHQMTQLILAGLARHPNAAGVLVLGLGCENNNIPEFKKVLGEYDPNRIKFLSTQEADDEIEAGLELLNELIEHARTYRRTPCPAEKLRIGLKCGGSDAFSGITANPLVGAIADRLTNAGGTAILTEVPEMFGAETILMERCASRDVFDKTVNLINDFKQYYVRHGQVIYENPSPGNKNGGITTLEEKSLGCTQKGGTSEVTDVLPYGGRAQKTGLNLLQGPGNDIVAVTALTAAGAHMVLFTTGRGTPLGAPVPTVKISTNSDLAGRKSRWIDFNAGVLLEGETMDATADRLMNQLLDLASGRGFTKNEENGYREIAIFKNGVTL
ncbi:UxaA family hydrolase [Paenibacillus turpanensis]|uniref:UxaA family hydrolase n=1 Tax=Paenibacillus turpanensis TaxID=2689078 RepID=UPI00140D28AE|nr:altronate dehydratase family protein [Paenibacillus turpanensis]